MIDDSSMLSEREYVQSYIRDNEAMYGSLVIVRSTREFITTSREATNDQALIMQTSLLSARQGISSSEKQS